MCLNSQFPSSWLDWISTDVSATSRLMTPRHQFKRSQVQMWINRILNKRQMCQTCKFLAFGFSVASWCVHKACPTSAPYQGITGALHTMTNTMKWRICSKKKRSPVLLLLGLWCPVFVCLFAAAGGRGKGEGLWECLSCCYAFIFIHWHWLLKTPWKQIPPPEKKKRFMLLPLTPIKPSACWDVIETCFNSTSSISNMTLDTAQPCRCDAASLSSVGRACHWICCKWSTLIR